MCRFLCYRGPDLLLADLLYRPGELTDPAELPGQGTEGAPERRRLRRGLVLARADASPLRLPQRRAGLEQREPAPLVGACPIADLLRPRARRIPRNARERGELPPVPVRAFPLDAQPTAMAAATWCRGCRS